jgi:hypothetical protein
MRNQNKNNRQFARQTPPEDPIDALSRRIERSLSSVKDAYPSEYGIRVAGLLEAALFLTQNGPDESNHADPSGDYDDPSESIPAPRSNGNTSPNIRSLRDQWAGGLPGHPQQIADALAGPSQDERQARRQQALRVTPESDEPVKPRRGRKPSKQPTKPSPDVARLRDSVQGLSGGNGSDFKVATSINSPGLDAYFDPTEKCYVCGGCNGNVAGHAPDKNMPVRGNDIAVILCDRTRLYLPREQVEAVQQ